MLINSHSCDVVFSLFSARTSCRYKIYSTFEIAWLLGWKYDENQPKPLTPGSGEKNLEEAVNELT